MALIIFLILGFALGYWFRGLKTVPSKQTVQRRYQAPMTLQQKLYMKSMHQSDSDRIRELNLLSANQSIFLRLLKQTFHDYDIAIKQQRFMVLDADRLPRAIFEYRDGTQPMKMADQEDGIPLFLYKALISAGELKKDRLDIFSANK